MNYILCFRNTAGIWCTVVSINSAYSEEICISQRLPVFQGLDAFLKHSVVEPQMPEFLTNV